MRKKHYGQKLEKQNYSWIFLALGCVLVLVAILLSTRQGGGDDGTPSITVDQEQIDYGDVKFDIPKTFAIKVTNTGDSTLRFREEPYIQVMEGC